MPVKTTVDADFAKGGGGGEYRVRFAVRSSPAGVAVGALFTQYARATYRNPLNGMDRFFATPHTARRGEAPVRSRAAGPAISAWPPFAQG